MLSWRFAFSFFVLIGFASPALAAPDEGLLGKAEGYPVGTLANWFFDEHVRVGSFSHADDIFPYLTVRKSASPLPLPQAANRPRLGYRFEEERYAIDTIPG